MHSNKTSTLHCIVATISIWCHQLCFLPLKWTKQLLAGCLGENFILYLIHVKLNTKPNSASLLPSLRTIQPEIQAVSMDKCHLYILCSNTRAPVAQLAEHLTRIQKTQVRNLARSQCPLFSLCIHNTWLHCGYNLVCFNYKGQNSFLVSCLGEHLQYNLYLSVLQDMWYCSNNVLWL